KFAMFDFGGTLGAKAKGGPKPGTVENGAVGAIKANESFEKIMDSYRVDWLPEEHPWRQELSIEDMLALVRKFDYLTDSAIEAIVARAKYSNYKDYMAMEEILAARRDAMIKGLMTRIAAIQGSATGKKAGKGAPPKPNSYQKNTSLPPDVVLTVDQAMKKLKPEGRLDARQAEVVSDYVGGDLWEFLPAYLEGRKSYRNQYGQENKMDKELSNRAREGVQVLDDLTERSPDLPLGLKLYRGKATSRNISPRDAGETVVEDVFLPTSLERKVAAHFIQEGLEKYGQGQGPVAILTEFKVMTAGVKGIFIPALYKAGKIEVDKLSKSESEVLLNRGLTFRSLGYRIERMFRSEVEVYVEMIGVYKE
ncbi:hypothetical protein E3A20_14210, partial [Planctomyces bekefii]